MITKAARAPFVPSPLGPIKSMLGPFSDQVDASCLVLRGLGQVDAPHGFMEAIDGLRGDSLYCKQTSTPSAILTTRCIPSTSVGAVAVVLSASRGRPKGASVTTHVTDGKKCGGALMRRVSHDVAQSTCGTLTSIPARYMCCM